MDPLGIVLEVDERLRQMVGGFGVEVVLAFPVIGARLDLPVIASAGSYDRVRITPDRAFRHALRRSASGLVVAHNHPVDSGPSEPDRAVTRRLVSAGMVLGVPLVAHVVSEPSTIHELVCGERWARDVPSLAPDAVPSQRPPPDSHYRSKAGGLAARGRSDHDQPG